MADYAIHDTTLTGISNVIRKKEGSAALIDPADYADRINLMGMLEEKTIVSSPIADFSDGADDVPTKSLIVTIPPTLSGVSSVTEKHTGRNLVNGYTDYSNVNKVIEPQFYKAGTYTFSCVRATNINGIYVRKGSVIDLTAESISSKYNTLTNTFTVSEDGYYFIQLYRNTSSPTWEDEPVTNVQLEFGSTAHAYEPYTAPTVYTANLGRTIHGGQVDIVNGEGDETHKGYTLDNLTWLIGTISGVSVWYVDLSTDGLKLPTNSAIFSGICDNYTPIRFNAVKDNIDTIALRDNGRLYVNNGSDTIQPTGKVTIELVTPEDFTFTAQEIPTRLGYNAFWSEQGDSEVTYRSMGTVYQYPEGEEVYF